jgi:hypothetical protein
MSSTYDRWLDEPLEAQDHEDAKDEQRWQVANEKAASAILEPLEGDNFLCAADALAHMFESDLDNEHYEDLYRVLIDLTLGHPVETSILFLKKIGDVIEEALSAKYYEELDS